MRVHSGLIRAFWLALLCVLFARPLFAADDSTLARVKAALNATPVAVMGVTAERVEVSGQRARVVLGQSFLRVLADETLFEETVRRVSLALHPVKNVSLFVRIDEREVPVDELLGRVAPAQKSAASPAPAAAPGVAAEPGMARFPFDGPLAGRQIVISPGHGWYWVYNLGGWYTQRGLTNGLIEDMSNWRMASHVIRALEHSGAYVFSCRERDMNTNEVIADNDGTNYSDAAEWITSSFTGYAGGTYRYANTVTNAAEASAAVWRPDFPADGTYAVYANFRAGDNRIPDARFTMTHAGGDSVVLVDQTRNDSRWIYIGSWAFDAGAQSGQGVSLSNQSDHQGVVVADAVKFGGGMGSLKRDVAPSGKPRWEEAARYWVEFVGAPGWAYNEDVADNTGDVTTRPQYANWQGADLFLSLHSNAYNETARGTETYMYDGTPTAGSETWRDLVHSQIMHVVRSQWAPDWIDRGVKTANFGELRPLETAAGCLTEIAFHDNAYDASYLKRPPFRESIARGIAKAALSYFETGAPLFPMPVRNLRIIPPEPGGLRLMWEPTADPNYPEAVPTHYRIYIGGAGNGFDNGTVTTTESYWGVENWQPGVTYSYRVAAVNEGGESVLSEPVFARIYPNQFPQVLIVNGFDRQDRSVQEEENTLDYARLHAQAIAAAGNYTFVSCSNEAVAAQLIDLPLFEMVDWIAGEEARLPEETPQFVALDANERARLADYLAGGGRLFISGSEIAWDAAEGGQADDDYVSFVAQTLLATYEADDAETYAFFGESDTLFAGLTGNFDDGTHGTYDVDWPDVISPASSAELCMTYSEGHGMAVCSTDGPGQLIYFGAPFEAIYPDALRTEIMRRIVADMLTGEADGDLDGDIDGDWDLDLDRVVPPDGDIEYIELDFGPSPTDGDEPAEDGDAVKPDGDEPADGDPSVDGDATAPDGDEPGCLPGYTQDGGMCIKIEETDGGGCTSAGAGGAWFVLVTAGLILFGVRRRRAQ